MVTETQQSERSKQIKVWTLMAATLILGVLLAFGRWASSEPMLIFVPVAWDAFPAGWILTIEYGVIVFMVAAVVWADRVEALFSSPATLTLLGAIALFTAGLYHDHSFLRWGGQRPEIWANGVNGYGSLTEFLVRPGMYALPHQLGAWPMAYGLVAIATSFVTVMGWTRPFLKWRWVLPAIFLVTITAAWIAFLRWQFTTVDDSKWLAGSLIVLPVLIVTLLVVPGHDRKTHCVNLIAASWLASALFPQFELEGFVFPMSEALARMHQGYMILALGDFLILSGSLIVLLSSHSTRMDRPAPGP